MGCKQIVKVVAAVTLMFLTSSLTICQQPTAGQPQRSELAAYLKDHWRSPEDYVVSKFKDHDLVFIGEIHRVKHDPLLIQALIPKLYKAGIYNLGMEFANYSDQAQIDQLIAAPQYDEDAARRFLFNQFTTFGYKEYMDIFRAAWALNRSLPKGAPPFRVVGLNYAPNWKLVTVPNDQLTDEQRKAIFYNGSGDLFMARVVLKEFIQKDQKALIYSGIHHAFTRYLQPVYDLTKKKLNGLANDRLGSYVYLKVANRAFTVFLHAPWQSTETSPSHLREGPPVGGEIDAVLASFKDRRVGFDVVGSPFGQLRDPNTYYALGHDDFKLEDFCDGYIYQKPFKDYEGVTTDPLFITEKNFADAVQGVPNFEARANYKTPEDLIRVMREEADIPARFKVWGVLQ